MLDVQKHPPHGLTWNSQALSRNGPNLGPLRPANLCRIGSTWIHLGPLGANVEPILVYLCRIGPTWNSFGSMGAHWDPLGLNWAPYEPIGFHLGPIGPSPGPKTWPSL